MTKYTLHILSFVVAVLASLPEEAGAIPAFSRRYDLPCHFCHDGYPKLSVLGEQFKERGFRLEDDVTEVSEWLRAVPVSGRAFLRQTFEEEGDAMTEGVFRLVSGGSLGSRLSYWLDDTYSLTSDGAEREGIDNAYLRVEILPEELYVRVGRMELDLPFTQRRTPQLFAYEIYFANPGFETDSIGVHQDGVELGGFVDDATRWSVAVVGGRNSEEQKALSKAADQFNANVFARLAHRFGEARAGAYLYWGRNTLARRSEGKVLEWDDTLFRLGGDLSGYLGRAHAYGTFLIGRSSNPFADPAHPEGTGEAVSFSGGFVQLDYAIRDELVVSGRLDLVRVPPAGSTGPSTSFVDFSPGLKLWLHPHVRLAVELGFRNQDRLTRGAFHVELVL